MRSRIGAVVPWALLAGVVLLAGPIPATAQIPDEFTNLKVVSKDISKRQLVSMMREFSGALGVRCKHCHVGESADSLEGYDFASDDLEPKRVAREMMRMTTEINRVLLPKTGRKSLTRVRCVTCHRGVFEPEQLDAILLGVVEEDGAGAAVVEYRRLREEHYGSASYDFSPATLNKVAETLAQERNDLDGALELMQLNVELHPDDAYSHLLLGQLWAAKGDKQAAISSIERSLEIEPDNGWAKRMLERVRTEE